MVHFMQMAPANERVQAALVSHGLHPEISRMAEGTRTAHDAASAVGCDLEQIVKSLLFVADQNRYFLALVSGPRRASTSKLTSHWQAPVTMAKAKDAERITGFPVGGVPPVGHASPLDIVMDQHLLAHDIVWAAAGTADTLFPISSADLASISRAEVADITE